MAIVKKHRNSIRTKLTNLSLKNKFLGMFSLNSALLLVSFILCFSISVKAYNHLLYKTVAGNLSYSSDTISSTLKDIETLSSNILSDNIIQNSLSQIKSTEDTTIRYNAAKSINTSLLGYHDTTRNYGISYIAIRNDFTVNSTNQARYLKTREDLLNQIYELAQSGGGSAKWIWEPGNREGLFLTRHIRQIKELSLKPMGELVINVDMDHIVRSANSAATQYGDSYYIIMNSAGSVIYSSKELDYEELSDLQNAGVQEYGPVPFKGHTYFAVRGTIPSYQWNYINLISFDAITRSLDLSFMLIFAIMLCCTIMILFISRTFIRSMVAHFDTLIYKMVAFSKNELAIPETNYHYEERQDEIGKMHQQFDAMMGRIQNLVNINYVNEILKQEAQLKALEAQINPHFLYNTLESINWRAKTAGNENISQMAESLGTLLRATLSNKQPLVKLPYELELVNCYMTIQKLRFEEELQYHIHVTPGIEEAVIPPLTIQPLVENAIHYGMEDVDDVCHVLIFIARVEDKLVVKVQNDGSVMEDSLLERLASNDIKPSGFGIGILNINQRIQILFGEDYGLTFSNENGFATATLTITYRTEV